MVATGLAGGVTGPQARTETIRLQAANGHGGNDMLIVDVRKAVGQFQLRVQLQAPPGVTALFGRSGSGKSLTLQCVAGLVTPDAGRIALNGQTLFDAAGTNLSPQSRAVGYVFQQYALFPHLTVAGNVAYGLAGLARPERAARVREALRAVRLSGLEERLPAELSGGQAQRVALARALATHPRVLLLDEPFAALDSLMRAKLHQELQELLQELAIPALLVTHDLAEAYALSRHLAVLEEGRVLQCGPREQIYYHPVSRPVAELVGMTNFLPGTVQGGQIHGPGYQLPAPAGLADGTPVDCGIRPEHIMLLRPEVAPPAARGALLGGRITEEVDYGSHIVLWLAVAGAAADLGWLAISLPNYIYDRLDVRHRKEWRVLIKPQHVQVMVAGADRAPAGGAEAPEHPLS